MWLISLEDSIMKIYKILILFLLVICIGLSAAGLGVAVQSVPRNASEVLHFVTIGNNITSAKYFCSSDLREYKIAENDVDSLVTAIKGAIYVKKLSSSDNYKNGVKSELTLITADGTEYKTYVNGYNIYYNNKKYSTNVNFSELLWGLKS